MSAPQERFGHSTSAPNATPWHFHRWTNWEDVKLGEEPKPTAPGFPVILLRQVITQQRRCTICNMIRSRYSA